MKKTVELPAPATTSENGRGERIRTSGPCLPNTVADSCGRQKSTVNPTFSRLKNPIGWTCLDFVGQFNAPTARYERFSVPITRR